MASRGKGGHFVIEGLLYHIEKRFGQTLDTLCIPKTQRPEVLKMAHNTAHWAAKKTRDRITISGMSWPTFTSDVKRFTGSCDKNDVVVAALPPAASFFSFFTYFR